MSKMEVFLTESLLQRARQRRLRALRHLHREGMTLRNIFDLASESLDVTERPKRGDMFRGLSTLR